MKRKFNPVQLMNVNDKRQAAMQAVKDLRGYEDDNLHEQRHLNCPSGDARARWLFQGAGEYIAADWLRTRYVSFRCSRCHWCVQLNSKYIPEAEEWSEIYRLEVLP